MQHTLLGTQTIGLNTDYTGYIAAFKERFGDTSPGVVAMAGSGGAGKVIGFALAQLGAKSLKLFDTDEKKSLALADALRNAQRRMDVFVAPSLEDACNGADGLINCTPLGMIGYGGNAFEMVITSSRKHRRRPTSPRLPKNRPHRNSHHPSNCPRSSRLCLSPNWQEHSARH